MTSHSQLLVRPPKWNSQLWSRHPSIPGDELNSWLHETGSLTKRLRSLYGARLGVEILFHQWRPAYVDECRLLHIPSHRYQLVREVLLHVDGKPLILARTILPQATIRIAHRNLSHLGTRPLGEVIFAYPDLERRQRQFTLAARDSWSQPALQRFAIDQTIWGRRTVYAIHHQPLLVSEFFLPDWPPHHP